MGNGMGKEQYKAKGNEETRNKERKEGEGLTLWTKGCAQVFLGKLNRKQWPYGSVTG